MSLALKHSYSLSEILTAVGMLYYALKSMGRRKPDVSGTLKADVQQKPHYWVLKSHISALKERCDGLNKKGPNTLVSS